MCIWVEIERPILLSIILLMIFWCTVCCVYVTDLRRLAPTESRDKRLVFFYLGAQIFMGTMFSMFVAEGVSSEAS